MGLADPVGLAAAAAAGGAAAQQAATRRDGWMLGCEQTTQSHTTAPISKSYYGKVVHPRSTEIAPFGGANQVTSGHLCCWGHRVGSASKAVVKCIGGPLGVVGEL